MSNIIDLSKLPISDGKQVINIIGLNDNGNIIRAENDTYSKSEIDEKVANVKVDLTGYATERWVKQQGYVTDSDVNDYVGNEIGQLEEIINTKQNKLVSGTNIKTINGNDILGEGDITIEGGGDSGAYILEGIEPILEIEYWYSPETGEFEVIYETNSEYSTSEERKTHNKKVIDAILEGKCKSLYYKKFVGNVDEKVIEVDENGREHRKTVNGYQYFPLSWTEYELYWEGEYIRFEGKFIEGYMQTPQERVIVLNKETAEIKADSTMTYAIGDFMYRETVSFTDKYKMERRVYDVAMSNKPVCLNIEGESTISRCFLKTKLKTDFETNTEQGIVWCDDVDGNRYEWLFEYNFNDGSYNEFAIPTITPIGGGSGDSYTKAEIDGMIGDINNILETI